VLIWCSSTTSSVKLTLCLRDLQACHFKTDPTETIALCFGHRVPIDTVVNNWLDEDPIGSILLPAVVTCISDVLKKLQRIQLLSLPHRLMQLIMGVLVPCSV
jgi:hypothetical protein